MEINTSKGNFYRTNISMKLKEYCRRDRERIKTITIHATLNESKLIYSR